MDHASVYVTFPDMATARRVARAVVEERLAACANLSPIESVYRWEGAIEESQEVQAFLKTRRALVPRVVERVKALHPYDVPCIVELPLARGHPAYLAWIDRETS